MGRILVGLDGSDDAKSALRWALELAEQRGDSIRAVYVYGMPEDHNPFLAAYSTFATSGSASASADQGQRWQSQLEQEAHRHAAGALSNIISEVTDSSAKVDIEPVAVTGSRPARVLLEQAKGCDLVVVGARGRDGFGGLKLGAVAEKLVRHAPCSVFVARSAR